jgi:hypothetical protein
MNKRIKPPALRACIKKRISQGMDDDDAEHVCRHIDVATSNYPITQPSLPMGTQVQADEDIASSPGPGWTSRGTNIGTDRVVKPDALSAANDWARAQKRPLGKKDWVAWQNHAQRLGLDPDAMDTGWRTIMGRPEQVELAAVATLKKIFGESVSWRGYGAPSMPPDEPRIGPEDIQPWQAAHEKKKRKKINSDEITSMGERISVNIKTHQAPQVGNARGVAQDANENPGFGFRTWSARMVFEMAQKLIGLYPLAKPAEILAMAIRKSGVLTSELTPEDDKMLMMAIDWAQSGAPKTNVRTGGTPGGPFRSTADSHFGNPRGTFGL